MWRILWQRVLVCALIGLIPAGALAEGSTQTLERTSKTRTEGLGAHTVELPAVSQDLDLDLPVPFPLDLTAYGSLPAEFAERARRLSKGAIRIKPLDRGQLVKTSDIFDAVATGKLPVGWSTPERWSDKNSAFLVFSAAVPFGLSPEMFVAWVEGDGGTLMAELYARSGIKALPCGILGPEGGGWYRQELTHAADLQGKTLRWQGLGAAVLQQLGVTTTSLAGAELLAALDRGIIDGTEFSVPQIDATMELWRAAKFYYYPGWHHPSTLFDLLVNRASWDRWSSAQQNVIAEACRRNLHGSLRRIEAEQQAGLDALRRSGVEIGTFPPELLARLKSAADDVLADQARRSPDFRRAYESYDRHR